jgi:hypothetical protein
VTEGRNMWSATRWWAVFYSSSSGMCRSNICLPSCKPIYRLEFKFGFEHQILSIYPKLYLHSRLLNYNIFAFVTWATSMSTSRKSNFMCVLLIRVEMGNSNFKNTINYLASFSVLMTGLLLIQVCVTEELREGKDRWDAWLSDNPLKMDTSQEKKRHIYIRRVNHTTDTMNWVGNDLSFC